MNFGLPYHNWKIKKGSKNMDVILTEDELKKAVKQFLEPKMKCHNIKSVRIRDVKIDNSKRLEVLAELEEKEIDSDNN